MTDTLKQLIEKISKNNYYISIFKNPFTYVTGAILLSILQISLFAFSGNPWGVSGAFANWGAWIFEAFGGDVSKWYYFSSPGAQATLEAGFLNNPMTMSDLGIIFGAFFATLMASQFKLKKIKSMRQVVAAVLGGLLMGYGARLAYGCNIGAFYSGISSLSLSGWLFAVGLFIGAFFGSKLLTKFFMG